MLASNGATMDHRYHAETSPISGPDAAGTLPGTDKELRAWRFDGFEFDLGRGELRGRDGGAIPLRPKAELLLRQFLARPGRLFSREGLMTSVWPATVVTTDSLVQCVGELRTALGDHAQRLIQTVSRRGYRFDAAVVAVSALPVAVGDVLAAPGGQKPPLPAASARPVPALLRGRRFALVALAVAAVLGAGAAWYRYLRVTGAAHHIDEVVRSRATVAVMPFVAATADPDLRPVALHWLKE